MKLERTSIIFLHMLLGLYNVEQFSTHIYLIYVHKQSAGRYPSKIKTRTKVCQDSVTHCYIRGRNTTEYVTNWECLS
jgi:hypothetical protein